MKEKFDIREILNMVFKTGFLTSYKDLKEKVIRPTPRCCIKLNPLMACRRGGGGGGRASPPQKVFWALLKKSSGDPYRPVTS